MNYGESDFCAMHGFPIFVTKRLQKNKDIFSGPQGALPQERSGAKTPVQKMYPCFFVPA